MNTRNVGVASRMIHHDSVGISLRGSIKTMM